MSAQDHIEWFRWPNGDISPGFENRCVAQTRHGRRCLNPVIMGGLGYDDEGQRWCSSYGNEEAHLRERRCYVHLGSDAPDA